MKLIVVKNYEKMSQMGAKIISDQIIEKPNSILGLATGGTPLRIYEILIEKYKNDWSKITTFNLDEYIGVTTTHPLSYHVYMQEKLFDHINIDLKNTYFPTQQNQGYDQLIDQAGGIDLQILGIGENAHIAFNEPGSKIDDKTRVVSLTASTIDANARYFDSKSQVPKKAITMGIGTILKAKKIVLLATGLKKAQAIHDAMQEKITSQVPASFLQKHHDVTIIADQEAASLLNDHYK